MFLVGGSQSDGFVKLDDTVVVDWLDGSKDIGDVGLVGKVFAVALREDEGGGFNSLVEGDDPIAVRFNRFGDFGELDGELEKVSEIMALFGFDLGGETRAKDLGEISGLSFDDAKPLVGWKFGATR